MTLQQPVWSKMPEHRVHDAPRCQARWDGSDIRCDKPLDHVAIRKTERPLHVSVLTPLPDHDTPRVWSWY